MGMDKLWGHTEYSLLETILDIISSELQWKLDISTYMKKREIPVLFERNLQLIEKMEKVFYDLNQTHKKDYLLVTEMINALRKYSKFYQKIVPASEKEFINIMKSLFNQFKLKVELMNGYKLLWNDDGKIRHEEIFQTFFNLVMRDHFESAHMALNWEPRGGGGRVDFRVSATSRYIADIEFKKSENISEQSIKNQLTTYMKPYQIRVGFCIVFVTSIVHKRKVSKTRKFLEDYGEREGVHLILIEIDITPHKISASRG